MLLYGAGRQRAEVKKEVKKVFKYLTKIINNWTAIRSMSGELFIVKATFIIVYCPSNEPIQ